MLYLYLLTKIVYILLFSHTSNSSKYEKLTNIHVVIHVSMLKVCQTRRSLKQPLFRQTYRTKTNKHIKKQTNLKQFGAFNLTPTWLPYVYLKTYSEVAHCLIGVFPVPQLMDNRNMMYLNHVIFSCICMMVFLAFFLKCDCVFQQLGMKEIVNR